MTEKLSQSDTLGQEVLPDYKNSKLSIDDRLVDFLNRMSLPEKIAQMICIRRQKESILFGVGLDF